MDDYGYRRQFVLYSRKRGQMITAIEGISYYIAVKEDR